MPSFKYISESKRETRAEKFVRRYLPGIYRTELFNEVEMARNGGKVPGLNEIREVVDSGDGNGREKAVDSRESSRESSRKRDTSSFVSKVLRKDGLRDRRGF